MINFKKIAAVTSGILMAGLTLGTAAAATFPAPFVQSGTANVAIVYGTGAGVSALDQVQAGNIQTKLGESMPSAGTTTTVSGEHVSLNRSSSLLHVGGYIGNVFGRSVTSSDLPTLLADGTFKDSSNNDHDYTQKIDMANLSISQFDLSQYDNSVSDITPTMGIALDSGTNVLNYTLNFQDNVNMSYMSSENLNIMGKDYYVLSASNGTGSASPTMTLLDSGVSATLSQGDTTSLSVGGKTYDVSIEYIDSTNVKLTVNGETTDTLQNGDTYKLSDGSYIGIKTVLSQNYAGGISTVDFSIGSGKLELTDGQDIQVNGNTVNGLTSYFTISGSKLSQLKLAWNTEDDSAITSGKTLTMPTFNGVTVSFSGMNYPASEMTSIKNDGNNAVQMSTTFKNGAVNFDILANTGSATNFTSIGKSSSQYLLQTSNTNSLTFNGTRSTSRFIVSWAGTKDSESYMLTANNFVNDSGTIKATIVSKDGGSVSQQVQENDQVTLGNVVLTVGAIDKDAKTIVLTANSGSSFNKAYTADGLQFWLPWVNMTDYTDNTNATTCNGVYGTLGNGQLGYNAVIRYTNGTNITCLSQPSSYDINFTEEDENSNVALGSSFQITVDANTDYKTLVDGVTGAGSSLEQQSSNIYQYTVSSALASKIEWDQGPTQQTADVTYHGGESYGVVYLTSPNAVTTSAGASALGNVLVKDSEISSVSDKNLIVVGGSCINSVAANLLGGAYCGTDFTAKTSVGAGQFLIQSFGDAYATGKVALLVAGYESADTVNAATYLDTKTVETTAGKKYVGTSATSATLTVN